MRRVCLHMPCRNTDIILLLIEEICPIATWWRYERETFSALLAGHLCRGIHRSPVKSPHKGQWRGALMLTLICTRINVWVNNRAAGHLRRHRAHYDVVVMTLTHGVYTTPLDQFLICVNLTFSSYFSVSLYHDDDDYYSGVGVGSRSGVLYRWPFLLNHGLN